MKKLPNYLLTVLLVFIFLFSGWKVVSGLWSYIESLFRYESLEQYISFETQVPTPSESVDSVDETEESYSYDITPLETEAPDDTNWPQVDFEQLQQINPDIVGWIYVEGTKINYPVVQAEDNDYYINRLFDGTRNSAGSIFLDYRCRFDFSDRHSILYGHNMKNKSMFAALMNYKDPDYFPEHPEALLLTPECNYKIRFFSGYVCDSWKNAWELDFDSTDFGTWLNDISKRSRFTPDLIPTEEDSILTLSTCSYEYHDARFVLHGFVVSQRYN